MAEKVDKVVKEILGNSKIKETTRRGLSLLFLSICGIMTFFSYRVDVKFWFDAVRTFRPGLISTIIAIFLVAPLYVRNIFKWKNSFYSILSLLLILLVFSSFVELTLGGNEGSTIIYALLSISIALSWLGIKEIAGICWIIVLLAGVYSSIISNIAMGFAGFIYITAGFVGLVLHTGLNPGDFVQGLKNEYSKPVSDINDRMKQDARSAKDKII